MVDDKFMISIIINRIINRLSQDNFFSVIPLYQLVFVFSFLGFALSLMKTLPFSDFYFAFHTRQGRRNQYCKSII